jgi:threonine dehydratase
MPLPTFADIEAAARRLAPHAVRTPLVGSPVLAARCGGRVFLKLETLQRTGSFKFRGACNRIALIPDAERSRGVVAFSSGNHAQGVAAAAALFGVAATIVMPLEAPRAKIEGTKALGARIISYDRQRDDREAIARRISEEQGATLVRPFDDAAVVAGQGTVGLEIAADAPGAALVLAPCSGGGLVSGVALGLLQTGIKAVSVEVENYDGMRLSLAAGRRVAAPGGALSIADSLMAPMPGEIPFALARELLGPGLCVGDAELERAVSYAAQHLGLILEPGGAAGLAALLAGKVDARGRSIVVVLSGSNCDFETVAGAVRRHPSP